MTAPGIGVMFPGQGTQRVGMGRWIERSSPAARAVFDTATEVLERDVRALCFSGPTRDLTLTQHAQVAIFTVNAAALAHLVESGHEPLVAIGHSVGELDALVAAGAVSLEQGLRLVAKRGELMGRIAAPGSMSAVLGLTPAVVGELCERVTIELAAEGRGDEPVVPALLNGPANLVVSGATAAVERVEPLVRAAGAVKVTRLVVSSAFHSPLMAEAVPEWREVVAGLELHAPKIPVVLNTTGLPAIGAEDVRNSLVDQLTGPVRWVEDVTAAAALPGVTTLVEAGDAKVLTALVRSIIPGTPGVSMNDPRALKRLGPGVGAAELSGGEGS